MATSNKKTKALKKVSMKSWAKNAPIKNQKDLNEIMLTEKSLYILIYENEPLVVNQSFSMTLSEAEDERKKLIVKCYNIFKSSDDPSLRETASNAALAIRVVPLRIH